MADSEHDAAEVIAAYRRRRGRMAPLLLGGFSVVLLVVGVFLIVVWLTGDGGPAFPRLFAPPTATPTVTLTPVPPTATPSASPTPATPTDTPTPEGPLTYIVEIGDTLGSIAERFGVELLVLMAVNGITDPNSIQVGQELTIPPAGSELPTPTALPSTLIPGSKIEYVVQPGDTLATIAQMFNSTVDAIVRENNIEDPNNIGVGIRLIVPVGLVTPVPTSTPSATPTSTGTP
jgi:LysM repeat protein